MWFPADPSFQFLLLVEGAVGGIILAGEAPLFHSLFALTVLSSLSLKLPRVARQPPPALEVAVEPLLCTGAAFCLLPPEEAAALVIAQAVGMQDLPLALEKASTAQEPLTRIAGELLVASMALLMKDGRRSGTAVALGGTMLALLREVMGDMEALAAIPHWTLYLEEPAGEPEGSATSRMAELQMVVVVVAVLMVAEAGYFGIIADLTLT